MAAIKKVEKAEIIKGAFNILEEFGIEGLNARSLAKVLGCSTKPIYFQFENMEALKGELKTLAEQKYIEITNICRGKYDNDYISYGMAYVTFAREEKHLFRYLYLSGREDKTRLQIDDANYDDIIGAIKIRYSISEQQAKALHFDMAIYSYGLAVMVNTGFIELDDNEILKRLTVQGVSLKEYYVKNRAVQID